MAEGERGAHDLIIVELAVIAVDQADVPAAEFLARIEQGLKQGLPALQELGMGKGPAREDGNAG
ncbi:hypothetical protein GCM10008942_29740 [Rhizomicrobium electricum]|uniref:Uncharacterized protein n=1 Tax=Rhizomicrobium electricum TaxID=480070 RepID=A0ABN1F045_9PROT